MVNSPASPATPPDSAVAASPQLGAIAADAGGGDSPQINGRRFSVFSKETLLPALRGRIKGAVLPPHTKGYEESLLIYNGAVTAKPAVVIRPYDSNDVASAVRVAKDFGLTISVRSGGHSATGKSIQGQIVLDLSRTMNAVWVLEPDPTHPDPYVRFDGGARVADIDEIIARRGYVTPLGTYQGIGVGSVLGGGVGYLSRQLGLSIDQVVEAEVVTSEGQIIVCSAKDNPDLFWGIRGAGSNFGIVTSVVMKLRKLRSVYSGMVIYPMQTVESAKDSLAKWARFMGPSTPDQFTTSAKLGCDAHGAPVILFSFCYAGSEEEAKALIEPFMVSLPFSPIMNSLKRRDYIQQQRNTSQYLPPAGYRWGVRSEYIDELTPTLIGELAESIIGMPEQAQRSTIDITLLGGAVARVEPGDTTWWHRKSPYEVTLTASWSEEEEDAVNMDWLVKTNEKVRKVGSGPSPNGNDAISPESIKRCYGDNYAKLQELKKKWDPENMFRFNVNIPPAP
ncbi:hypothetical protein DFJ74DRAFT_654404 [Hyaloraphidium curvatum]|nr:hypothetical protein DFJ74DRAFT_654404 [Hyaloraphidium curvatum]